MLPDLLGIILRILTFASAEEKIVRHRLQICRFEVVSYFGLIVGIRHGNNTLVVFQLLQQIEGHQGLSVNLSTYLFWIIADPVKRYLVLQ